MEAPFTVERMLHELLAEPGRPRLTWYGADGERVELSGQVLAMWVAKTTNLLVEELDAGPGTRVLLDLPVHWRTIVWALAVWRCGACVVLESDADRASCGDLAVADIVVTDRPHEHQGEVIAVTLPALARRFPGELPPGAIDAAADVMTYGDVVGWAPEVEGDAVAVVATTGPPPCDPVRLPHGELGGWLAAHPDWPARPRLLVHPRAGAPSPALLALVRSAGAGLATDGSLVIADFGPSGAPADTPVDPAMAARSQAIAASERVTSFVALE